MLTNRKRIRQLFLIETKKMLLTLPKLLLGSVILSVTLFLLFYVVWLSQKNSTKKAPVQISIVADKKEPFLDWMIQSVKSMPNVNYSFKIKRQKKEEAEHALLTGKTDMIFFIPKKYVSSIIHGDNKHIIIRFSNTQTTIVSYLMKQQTSAASAFILDSEGAIYSMQDYYAIHDLPDARQDELALNIKYINEIIQLPNAIREKPFQSSTSILISGVILFTLFLGVICGAELVSEKTAYKMQLKLYQITPSKQLLVKNAAFFICMFCIYLLSVFCLIVIRQTGILPFSESILNSLPGIWKWLLYCFPFLLFSVTYIQLIYEITEELLSGILLLSVSIIFMGFFSGYFYPIQYLPKTVQNLSSLLPMIHAHNYLSQAFSDHLLFNELIILLGYSLLLFLLTLLVRNLHERKIS